MLIEQIRVERKQLQEIVDWMREKNVCFYCGEAADEREHVVPRHTHLPTRVVPSCGECNRFASGELFATIVEKHEAIRAKRRRKYHKLLCMPEWTPDEITEMGTAFRHGLTACSEARGIVKTQLEWDPLGVLQLL